MPTANEARKFERIPSHPAQYGQKMQTEKNLLGTPFPWEPCVFKLSCPKLCYATDHTLQIGIKAEEEIMKVPAVHRSARGSMKFWGFQPSEYSGSAIHEARKIGKIEHSCPRKLSFIFHLNEEAITAHVD